MKQILKKPLRVAQIFGLLVATTMGLNAQTGTIQIGSGTNTGSTMPVTVWDMMYSQQIVTATEYATGNGLAGNITKIRWMFPNIGTTTSYGDWDVYIGHTTKTSFASNSDWVPIGDLTQVFSGNIHTLTNPPTANQWFEIEFSTPFNYNGTDNIVVAVNEKTPGFSGAPTKRSYNSGPNTGIYARRDGAPYDPANLPNASARTGNLPQLQFEGQLATCFVPTGLSFTQTSMTSADLTWSSDGSNVENYDVEWGIAGFSLGSGTSINGITTTSTSVTTIQDQDYEFYVRQNCGANGESSWVGPFTFKTGYCMPLYTTGCSAGSKVANFEINDAIINLANNTGTSTCGQSGYNNFASMSATASEGTNISYLVRVGSYAGGVKIWIDWNNNGVFDTDEIIGQSTSTIGAGTDFTGTFQVPAGTPIGDYRLRVRVVESSTTFTACSSHSYGEAEDYTFKVITQPACLPPTGLTFTQNSLTSATIGWTSSGTLFDVEWGVSGFTLGSGTQINGLTTTSTSLTTIMDTNYEFYVRQDCGGGDVSIWTGPFAFRTGYCIPTQGGTEYINDVSTSGANVNLSNLNNGSQTGGYGNFTALPFSVSPGGTFTLTVTAGFSGLAWAEAFAVWIDLNNNGTFEASEQIHSTAVLPSSPTPSFTHTITAPSTEGSYRMRIVMQYNQTLGTGDSCITSDGETEDYTLVVTSSAPNCLPPAGLGFTSTSLTSVDLTWNANGGNVASYDVEWGTAGFSLGSGTAVNGLSTTSTSVTIIQDTDYEFYVRQNCGADGQSAWAGPFPFKTTGYCVPEPENTWEWIDGFSTSGAISNITNTSNGAQTGGYADFTSMSATVTVGSTFNFTVDFVSTFTDEEGLAIWIDENNNGIFETTERVYTSNGTTTLGIFSGSITAPATAGTYRMRVVMEWDEDNPSDPCLSFLYFGEIEDYTLVVLSSAPNCLPPTALGFTPTSLTSVDLTWNANGGNVASYDVEWGAAGFSLGSGTTVNGVTTTSTSVTTIQDTDYEFYVRQNCGADGESSWTGPFPFKTGYCVPSYNFNDDYTEVFSTSVNGTTFVNYTASSQTGINGYNNLVGDTSYNTIIAAGETINFSHTYFGDFGLVANTLRIWVDWNNNGTFEDSETVFGPTYSTSATQTDSFTISNGQTPGNYRMRVRTRWGNQVSDITACDTYGYGQAFDFTIVVTNATSCTPVTALDTSNITQNSVEVAWTAGGSETAWNVEYGVQGFSQGSGTTINGVTNPYTITGLTAGTSYDVYVQADCGNGSTSTWTGPHNFTTTAAFSCPSPLTPGTVTTTPDSGSAGTIFDVTATGYDTGADITYTWEKSEDSGATWIPVGTANSATYSDLIGETAPASGLVEYRLTISCGGNSESASATFTVTVSRSDFDVFGFTYYPNPVNDMLHFSSNQPIENVVVSNMLGQQVRANLSSDKTSLDMSSLPTGNYLVKVTIEGVAKMIKVVKQ